MAGVQCPLMNDLLTRLLAGALLFTGGLDVKSQEAALRAAPDILIATPGRLIDHLHNCPSFHLSSIEVLILDEADRYACLWATGVQRL